MKMYHFGKFVGKPLEQLDKPVEHWLCEIDEPKAPPTRIPVLGKMPKFKRTLVKGQVVPVCVGKNKETGKDIEHTFFKPTGIEKAEKTEFLNAYQLAGEYLGKFEQAQWTFSVIKARVSKLGHTLFTRIFDNPGWMMRSQFVSELNKNGITNTSKNVEILIEARLKSREWTAADGRQERMLTIVAADKPTIINKGINEFELEAMALQQDEEKENLNATDMQAAPVS